MNKQNLQLVIPMSGSGKRFLDAGYTVPKPLIEVDGIPMIKHVVSLFPGIKDVLFICNKEHLETTNMRETLNAICPHAKIVQIDKHKNGPVYAVAKAFDFLSDDKEIIISYCDYGTVWDFDKFLKEIRTGNFDGALACYKGFHPHMLGNDNYAFCRENEGVLLEIKEKEPFTNDRMSEFASNGTYYFKNASIVKKYFQEAIDSNVHVNNEHYVSLVYNLLVRDNLKTLVFEIEKMLQWGTPYDLEVYNGWSNYFSNISKPTEKAPSQDYTLVLPMSGKGSRFSQEGYDTPKPFILVDDIPMVIKAVECLPKHKDSIFICLEEHMDKASNILLDYYPNAQIYPIKSVTEGQACTCEIGIQETGIDKETSILISACDNGAFYNEQKFLDLINDETNDVIVWSFRNNQTSKVKPDMYSWLEVDDENNILSVSCKKFTGGNPLEKHAIIGTMYYRKAKDFLNGLQENYNSNSRTNNEFYVDDVINRNIEEGLTVKVFEVDNYICWGTPDDYKTYNYWGDYFSTRNN